MNQNTDPQKFKFDLIKQIDTFSDVDQKLISPSRRNDLKKLQRARYIMMGAVLITFIFLPLIVISIPLFLWGLRRYKNLKPKLERDLAPYRHTKQIETKRH